MHPISFVSQTSSRKANPTTDRDMPHESKHREPHRSTQSTHRTRTKMAELHNAATHPFSAQALRTAYVPHDVMTMANPTHTSLSARVSSSQDFIMLQTIEILMNMCIQRLALESKVKNSKLNLTRMPHSVL